MSVMYITLLWRNDTHIWLPNMTLPKSAPKMDCRLLVALIVWCLFHSPSNIGIHAVPLVTADEEGEPIPRTMDNLLSMKRDSNWKMNSIPPHWIAADTRQQTEIHRRSTGFMFSLFNGLLLGKKLTELVIADQTDGRINRKKLNINTVRCLLANNEDDQADFWFKAPKLQRHEHLRMAQLRFLGNQTEQQDNSITVVFRRNNHKENSSTWTRHYSINGNRQLDITEELSSALRTFKANITVEVRLPNAGRSREGGRGQVDNTAPVLVVYTQDRTFVKNVFKRFTTNANSLQSGFPLSRTKRSSGNDTRKRKRRKRKNRWRKNGKDVCKVHSFTIDFDLIGWGPWIIHPKKFNAKLCYGQCPSPLGHKYSPTNHAMLQSLMTMKRPLSAPEPCCVPTKLRPLSMLYFEYEDIVVRHHEDMIVDECGCR